MQVANRANIGGSLVVFSIHRMVPMQQQIQEEEV